MITVAPECDLEIATDALVALLLGPEFAKCLDVEYARQPVKLAIRYPEFGYIDEVETLDGYPAFELVSGPTEEQDTNPPGYVHEISLQWTVNGDNEQIMKREIMRLIAASRRFFGVSNGSLLPFVGGKFTTSRSDTGPTARARNNHPFLKSASLAITWRVYGL